MSLGMKSSGIKHSMRRTVPSPSTNSGLIIEIDKGWKLGWVDLGTRFVGLHEKVRKIAEKRFEVNWAHISGRQTPGLTRGFTPFYITNVGVGVNPGLNPGLDSWDVGPDLLDLLRKGQGVHDSSIGVKFFFKA
jgi:hypothetical protein